MWLMNQLRFDIDEDIVNVKDYVKDHKRFQLLSKNLNATEQLQNAYQENKVVNNLIAAKQRS